MCLITSQLTPYTLKSEITAYKMVTKKHNIENVYITPFRSAKFDFTSNPTSPIELTTGNYENQITQSYGSKISVGSGYYHALLDPSQYSLYSDDYTIIKVTIPISIKIKNGEKEETIPTAIYISDNMNEICTNNIKIYNEEIDVNNAKTKISDINDKLNIQMPDKVTVEYADGNIKLSTPNYSCILITSSENYNTKIQWSKVKTDVSSNFKDLPVSYNDAQKYFNGKADTDIIKQLETAYKEANNKRECYSIISKLDKDEYIPSVGELYDIIKYQHYINYTLKLNNADNDKLIQNGIYWSSTPYASNNAWGVNTNYIPISNIYARQANYSFLPVKAQSITTP